MLAARGIERLKVQTARDKSAILAFPVMLLVTMASVFLATCMHPTKNVVLFQLTDTKTKKHFSKVYFISLSKIKTIIMTVLVSKLKARTLKFPKKVVN